MSKDKDKLNDSMDLKNLDKEAYNTLVEWAKSAPKILRQLEESGDKENIKKFKIQIKLVVNKLEDIQQLIKNKSFK